MVSAVRNSAEVSFLRCFTALLFHPTTRMKLHVFLAAIRGTPGEIHLLRRGTHTNVAHGDGILRANLGKGGRSGHSRKRHTKRYRCGNARFKKRTGCRHGKGPFT